MLRQAAAAAAGGQQYPAATLYLVATPIGNLADLSLRAIHCLGLVDALACEDTRQGGALLRHLGLHKPLVALHQHNEREASGHVIARLAAGERVAYASDAGTPAINDPGYELVKAALDAGFPVLPVPGASAPIAALTVSGLPTDSFLYLGYLPHKSNERRKALRQVQDTPYTLIFLESPYRITEALEDISTELGDRRILVAREMTKMFEEYWRGTVQGAFEYFRAQPARGEFTLVVEGRTGGEDKWTPARLEEAARAQVQEGKPASQIAGELAALSGWKKREVYLLVNGLKGK